MRIRTTTTALAAVVVFTLAGCSSSGSDSKGVDEPGVTTPAGVTLKVAAKTDAAAITKKLAESVSTVTTTVVYTASNDPNTKLGRPHQYTSKTAFADSRIPKTKAKEDANGRSDAISYGGTVEVFANDADAKAWIGYVDNIGKAVGGLVTPDYLLRQGRYVIRASHLLTPVQVDGYKAVLAKLG